MSKPLSVAIAAVIRDGEILLIKRERGDYTGYWGLPGGKVELEEHVSEAAEREIEEECDLETEFVDYIGTVSEHLVEEEFENHFILHVCELEPEEKKASGTEEEGVVDWFEFDELENIEIIPSDRAIIEEVVLGEGGYFECLMDSSGEEDVMERFELR